MSACTDPAVLERQQAISKAFGYWSIIRKGRRDKPPHVHRYKDEASARIAWDKLDVRAPYHPPRPRTPHGPLCLMISIPALSTRNAHPSATTVDFLRDLDALLAQSPAAACITRFMASRPRPPELPPLPTPTLPGIPTHRRAKWLITRALNLKPRRGRRAEELRRVLVELDRYLQFWLEVTRKERHRHLTVFDDIAYSRRGVPAVKGKLLVHWAIEVLVALSKWAP